VNTEQHMTPARACLAGVRGGVTPELLRRNARPATVEEAPVAFADEAGIAGDGQWLELAPTADGLDLRSAAGDVFGRLAYAHGGDRLAQTADAECRLAFERNHGTWAIVARAPGDAPVAAYYRGWRTGGDVWVSPDRWLTLRWTPLARGGSWMLTSDGEEILRLQPNAADRVELLVQRVPERAALLILLVCQIVMTEIALGGLVLGDAGGVELALVAP
jgi:hypothetical protein